MGGKPWSKKDVYLLYKYAEWTTQRRAAERLGRSLSSVQTKVKQLRIRWSQGKTTLNQIARDMGCSPNTVHRMFHILFDAPRTPGYTVNVKSHRGNRYYLNDEDASRLRAVLQRSLRTRDAHRVAGRKAHKTLTPDGAE